MKPFLLISIIWLFCAPLSHATSVKYPQDFIHAGEKRLFYVNVPRNLPKNAPLIVALHGMGGQAHKMRYGLGLHDLASEMGFAALFPQGGMFGDHTTYWNSGQGLGNHDDLGFLTRLIDHIVQEHELDASRVYILGISNGAQMAYHLACHIPERIAGIAAVSGTITTQDWSECHLNKSVSLLHIHGIEDPVMPFDGGVMWHSKGERYYAVPDLVEQWATQIGAVLTTAPEPLTSNIAITHYETPEGVPIELHSLSKFGHDWPNPKNAGFSAARLITSFFMGVVAKGRP